MLIFHPAGLTGLSGFTKQLLHPLVLILQTILAGGRAALPAL